MDPGAQVLMFTQDLVKMQSLIHKVCNEDQKFTFLASFWEMLRFLVYTLQLSSKDQCIAGSESAGS